MERTYIQEIKKGPVFLEGWVHEIRDLAKIKFLLIRDITGIVQCIIKDEKLMKKFSDISIESVISIQGEAKTAQVKSSEVTQKSIEIEVKALDIINKAEKLPINLHDKNIETGFAKRLDYRCISLRDKKSLAIFKIEAALIEGMQKYLNNQNFIQVFTPCLMGGVSESGSDVFLVTYFDKKAFLRQDPQLHRQLTIVSGLEKIYDIGPSWRAEKSHTIKHLTEHRTCAVELAFIKSEQDTMRVEEQVIISAIKNVIEKCEHELKLLNVKLDVPKAPFPELKFSELHKILAKSGKKVKPNEEPDTESEKLLSEYVKKEYKSDFFFINGFPFKLKPFYVYHDDEYAGSVDLYCKHIELSSGGQREHRYDILMKNIKEKKVNPKSIEWFTQFFKWGVPSHGGFSIGIERFTQVILGLENIRDAVLFPRDTERLTP